MFYAGKSLLGRGLGTFAGKEPEGLERSVSDLECFAKQNMGKFCKDFLFNRC